MAFAITLAATILFSVTYMAFFVAPGLNLHLMENREAILRQRMYDQISTLRTDPQELARRVRQGDSFFRINGVNIHENRVQVQPVGQYIRVRIPYNFTNLLYNKFFTKSRIDNQEKTMEFIMDRV